MNHALPLSYGSRDGISIGGDPSRACITETDLLVRTSQDQACDERWTSWPTIHESAVASGNVLLFRVFASIGNLFIALEHMMQVIKLFVTVS